MVRRTSIVFVSTVLAASWLVVDSPDADAQRLFQRLRNRIRQQQLAPQQLSPGLQGQGAYQRSPRYVPSPNSSNQTAVPGSTRQPQIPQPRVPQPIQNRAGVLTRPSAAPLTPPVTGAAQLADPSGRSILSNRSNPPVDAVIPQVSSQPRVSLGIRVVQQLTGIRGLKVVSISPDSKVDEAGLRIGDLIVTLNGRVTTKVEDIIVGLSRRKAGDEVQVRIVRGRVSGALNLPVMETGGSSLPGSQPPGSQPPGSQPPGSQRQGTNAIAAKPPVLQPRSSAITRVEADGGQNERTVPASTPEELSVAAPEPEPEQFSPALAEKRVETEAVKNLKTGLGIKYTDASRSRGTFVTEIEASSPADAAGLQVGDRIVAVQGRLLANSEALERVVKNLPADQTLPLRIVRDDKLISVDVDLQAAPATTSDGPLANSTEPSGHESLLGSLIGGFFGNSKPKTAEKVQQVKGESNTRGDGDALALDDDEPVRQAGFTTDKAEMPEQNLDAPSLKQLAPPDEKDSPTLVPPSNSIAPEQRANANEADEIRRQIRELKERLKDVEGKQ